MYPDNFFCLSYPKGSEEQLVFEERALIFFKYSVSNAPALIFGALLITTVLLFNQASILYSSLLLLLTSSVVLSVLFISKHCLELSSENKKLSTYLKVRSFLGCVVGVLFSSAIYLLPEENASQGSHLVLLVLSASVTVAIMQYSVMPLFCILFNLSIFLPTIIFFSLNPNPVNLLTVGFLIILSATIMIKGLKISEDKVNLIKTNMKLKAEVHEHLLTRKKLKELALYDQLTKVANRYLFHENAEVLLVNTSTKQQTAVLLYIDLNDFKEINDKYGHSMGDKVLIETARRLRSKVRSTDIVARIGGDEFIVMLENYHPDINRIDNGIGSAQQTSDPVNLISAIHASLNEDIILDNTVIVLRASIGISTYPIDATNLEDLMHVADANMYEVKDKTC